ncbi:hypothetical protein BGZ51_000726, partial [Haplosporangium sp. Z 767]
MSRSNFSNMFPSEKGESSSSTAHIPPPGQAQYDETYDDEEYETDDQYRFEDDDQYSYGPLKSRGIQWEEGQGDDEDAISHIEARQIELQRVGILQLPFQQSGSSQQTSAALAPNPRKRKPG